MKKRSLYIPPPGYVAGVGELVGLFVGVLIVAGLGFMMWGAWIEIPPVPKKVVLRSASVTHDLGVSKSTAHLYIKVAREEGDYDYLFELPYGEARLLGVHKFKKLWVAIDANSDNQFVWAVYDEKFQLVASRQQIVRWAKHNNGAVYLMVAWSCLGVAYGIFYMVMYGILNRYYGEEDG